MHRSWLCWPARVWRAASATGSGSARHSTRTGDSHAAEGRGGRRGAWSGTQGAIPCHEAFRQSRTCHGTRVRSFCSHATLSPTRHVVPWSTS